uniref:Uncharacterized protein n=1 Tax=Nothobranchius furzeri TaxID=105023 RepID=A0A8C6KEL1_NOTFU
MFGAEPRAAHCFQLSPYLALPLSLSLAHTQESSVKTDRVGEGRGGDVLFFFLPPFFPPVLVFTRPQSKKRRSGGESAWRRLGVPAEEPQTQTLKMLGRLLILFIFLASPQPADGQTGGRDGGKGGTERFQVMFTPTICKVLCSQDRCVNHCERGNVTTLYSSGEAGGRGDGTRGPGFRVCKVPAGH